MIVEITVNQNTLTLDRGYSSVFGALKPSTNNSGFFIDKISKTQGEKNSRMWKFKPNFAQKLKVPELFHNSNHKKLKW